MTTIGLASAGLLIFPQGLSLVFGANIGTTGTGWLVALLGVRVSLTAAALPIVFVGALMGGRGQRNRGLRAYLDRADDTSAGHERVGRSAAPGGPSKCLE